MKRAVIYIRTSTVEQNPENQLKDCTKLAKNRGYNVIETLKEQVSAYKKDVDRPKYDKVKEMAHKGEIDAVIVWALDRWIRNRDKLLEDITTLRNYGCKIHSVKEQWLESINIEGPLGKTIREFLISLQGAMAEMESKRHSERTIAGLERARTNGKKLGRPQKIGQNGKKQIKLLRERGYSYQIIADQAGLSKAHVWRIINNKA